MRGNSERLRLSTLGRTAVALVVTAILLFPVYWIIVASFERQSDLYSSTPHLFPPAPTLANFRTVFPDQISAIGTSCIVALATTALSLFIALPVAYALAALRSRWIALIVFLLLVAQMVPSVMNATPLYLAFNDLRLTNSYAALIIADSTYAVPFAILVLRAFLLEIPPELREAALVDGASEWRALTSVILPIIRPGLVAASLFSFLFAWGDFVYALTMSNNGSVTPLTLSIYSYLGSHLIQWNLLMAAATLGLIPGAVLLVVAQRYVAAGLTAGAVKG